MYGSLFLCIYFFLPRPCESWQYFTTLSDIKLQNAKEERALLHSSYFYGACQDKDKTFVAHVHLEHMDVLGKRIIRGWLDIKRIPTCIIIRAMAYEWDLFRNTGYEFQICVPRITYCHSQRRYMYFMYEWYHPIDMIGGMDWDLYFYGPTDLFWD